MKIDFQNQIVRTAVFSYAGVREYKAFICRRDFFPGSGDAEDEKEVSNDRQCECFELCFENFLSVGEVCASGGFFETLADAISHTEKSWGFVKWI